MYNARGNLDREVSAIIHDSRKVIDNSVFLCIEGEKVDGHDFAQQVLDDGAMAVISQKKLPGLRGTYLLVDSVLEATQAIAEYYRRQMGIYRLCFIPEIQSLQDKRKFQQPVGCSVYDLRDRR